MGYKSLLKNGIYTLKSSRFAQQKGGGQPRKLSKKRTWLFAGEVVGRATQPLLGGYLRQNIRRRSELRDQATAGGGLGMSWCKFRNPPG